MSSPIEICNVALWAIGAEEIRDFDDSTKRHRVCKTMYFHVRDTLLTDTDWTFARGRATLRAAAEDDGVTDAYGSPYELPNDCVRPLDIMPIGAGQKWELIGGLIYTSVSDPVLVYIKTVVNSGLFPKHFVNALAMGIAAAIAPAIRQNEKFEVGMEKKAAIALLNAQEIDARIGSTYRHPDQEAMNDSFVNPDLCDGEIPVTLDSDYGSTSS